MSRFREKDIAIEYVVIMLKILLSVHNFSQHTSIGLLYSVPNCNDLSSGNYRSLFGPTSNAFIFIKIIAATCEIVYKLFEFDLVAMLRIFRD